MAYDREGGGGERKTCLCPIMTLFLVCRNNNTFRRLLGLSPFFRAHAYVADYVFAHPLQKPAERRGEREAPSSKKCRHRTNGALLAHPLPPPCHTMSCQATEPTCHFPSFSLFFFSAYLATPQGRKRRRVRQLPPPLT